MIPRAFAAAAAFERDTRAARYPKRIERGDISAEDAEADFAAWSCIAAWLAGRPSIEWGWCSFAEMELASGRALLHLEEKCKAKPDDERLALRRDAVSAVHSGLQRMRAFLDGLTVDLRAQAEKARAA